MSCKNEQRIDHIAVAVSDIEEALSFYRDELGMGVLSVETVESEGVRVAKLDAGNTHIELLEPLSPETPVGRFIEKRGPGLHHICVGVSDIDDRVQRLSDDGVKLINQQAKIGAGGAMIAFVHPRSTGGVLLELSQPAPTTTD